MRRRKFMRIEFEKKQWDILEGQTVYEAFKTKIENSDKKIIACRVNNEVKSLDFVLRPDDKIELLDIANKDGRRIYIRGLLFVMGKAFEEIYPEARLTVNYQMYHSMFCEVENMSVTADMIEKVNKKMREIIQEDLPIVKKEMSKKEAEEFYKKHHTLKGRLQLDIEEKKNVLLYYCEDYFNYFYGVMPITTGYMRIFEMIKYSNGFLIRYPSKSDITKLPVMQDTQKLLATLNDYEMLHRTLNINTIYKLNKEVKENNIREDILIDEALHEKKIAGIADDIIRKRNVKVILIAGPSSSGKTTFAERLGIQLKINGLKPVTISVDNYFVEREHNPKDENGNYDFECIEAIDLDLFNHDLIKLLNGEEVDMPTFDFTKGKKLYHGNKLKLKDNEILVIEGIHCLNDKLTSLIPKEQKYKIYISALTVLNIDYFNRISTSDTRLIRRMVRDHQFRGYSALHTLKMWDSVRRGEEKNIFPYQEEADSMFNSSLIYELGVLKDYAMPLLKEIDSSQPEFSEAKRLYRFLSYFESIPTEYVPSHSLLREFIGGSIFHVS